MRSVLSSRASLLSASLRTASIPVRLIKVPWLIPRWARAQVWGRFILIRRGVAITEQLLAHELAHVLQWQIMGIFPFVACYLKYFRRHGYQNHPLELQAQNAEHQDFYRSWARQILAAAGTASRSPRSPNSLLKLPNSW